MDYGSGFIMQKTADWSLTGASTNTVASQGIGRWEGYRRAMEGQSMTLRVKRPFGYRSATVGIVCG